MTRTSHRWQSKPGRFDVLHALERFPSDNELGIPCLAHVPAGQLPRWLAPYRTRIRANDPPDDGAVHFFLDDYRFETVWSRPRKALQALAPYPALAGLFPVPGLAADAANVECVPQPLVRRILAVSGLSRHPHH